MQNKISLMLLAILSSLLLSCASVPDEPVCIEINPDKGWCTNTISDKEFFVDETNKLEGKTWWEMKPSFIYLPPSTWAKLKAYLIKNCKKNKDCQENIALWERKIQTIEAKQKK